MKAVALSNATDMTLLATHSLVNEYEAKQNYAKLIIVLARLKAGATILGHEGHNLAVGHLCTFLQTIKINNNALHSSSSILITSFATASS